MLVKFWLRVLCALIRTSKYANTITRAQFHAVRFAKGKSSTAPVTVHKVRSLHTIKSGEAMAYPAHPVATAMHVQWNL